jgi:[acyl-carrier-protein] S-malonyltransferase
MGLLDGRPLERAKLDRRLAALREGPRSSALPKPGTAEDRQLTRWVAQVVLTEKLCIAEAAERGLLYEDSPPVQLDPRAAVEMGSIATAAFEGCAAVRAVYADVTAEVTVPAEELAYYRESLRLVGREANSSNSSEGDPAERLLDASRRLTFVRWLDHARAKRLTLLPGLEHPGDPRQPDNHHQH